MSSADESSEESVVLIPKRKRGRPRRDAAPIPKRTKGCKSSENEEDNFEIKLEKQIDNKKASKFRPISIEGRSARSSQSGRNNKKEDTKPVELFRKDFLTAMKLGDSECLEPEEYHHIQDRWCLEWERMGVQVPVSPDNLPTASVENNVIDMHDVDRTGSFKLPKRYLKFSDQWRSGDHHSKQSSEVCRYDVDDLDVQWLKLYNQKLTKSNQKLDETVFESVIEQLEIDTFLGIEKKMSEVNPTGLTSETYNHSNKITVDDDVVCDVCYTGESEEGNELVFCDQCNVCVHQACYGIIHIPMGQWLCKVCDSGKTNVQCTLCPNKGGAMKCTRTGNKWAHVSCALWIPECGFTDVDKMEPVIGLSSIPEDRWSLTCKICKVQSGACIQCGEKKCSVPFHTTCAFRHNLKMEQVLCKNDVELMGFCPKHTKSMYPEMDEMKQRKTYLTTTGGSQTSVDGMASQPVPSQKLCELERQFYTIPSATSIAHRLTLSDGKVQAILGYWHAKRMTFNNNKPLLAAHFLATLKSQMRDGKEDPVKCKMRYLVYLRQDLERVRNLCYLITKREKLKRQLYLMRHKCFLKAARYVRYTEAEYKIPELLRLQPPYDRPKLFSTKTMQKLIEQHTASVVSRKGALRSASVTSSQSISETSPANELLRDIETMRQTPGHAEFTKLIRRCKKRYKHIIKNEPLTSSASSTATGPSDTVTPPSASISNPSRLRESSQSTNKTPVKKEASFLPKQATLSPLLSNKKPAQTMKSKLEQIARAKVLKEKTNKAGVESKSGGPLPNGVKPTGRGGTKTPEPKKRRVKDDPISPTPKSRKTR